MFTHQLCHPVPPPSLAWFDSATGRIPPTVLYCWGWCLLSRSECLLSFSPRLATSLGANDSVVTGHGWTHSVPRSSRRDTGGNDGFTAWQIRIRSLGRRLGLLAVLWCYSGGIALMLVHGLHGWNILWQEKKISVWPKSGPVKTGPTWPSATPLIIKPVYRLLRNPAHMTHMPAKWYILILISWHATKY